MVMIVNFILCVFYHNSKNFEREREREGATRYLALSIINLIIVTFKPAYSFFSFFFPLLDSRK